MNVNQEDKLQCYDVLIVGGGSSGSVLANRLTENSSCRVLLLESGPATATTDVMSQAVNNANQPAVMPDLNWKIRTKIKAESNSSLAATTAAAQKKPASIFDYEAGKILGGSSAINAVQALRGAPIDYDEWVKDCGDEWSWKGVLPYFKQVEADPIGSEDLHGRDGFMPITRESKEQLTPLQMALLETCVEHGFAETEDHNDPGTTGVGIIPKNVVKGVRMSTAITYLDAARQRSNLDILTGTHVHRLIINNESKCEGVEAEVNGILRSVYADKVILCAGTMSTPVILMRSGIADPALLEPLDIKVKSPLKGVGKHLMDHPVVGIWGIPKPEASTLGEPLRQTLLRYTSSDSGYENDMHICMMSGIDARQMFPHLAAASTAQTVAGITTCFNKSTSSGHVRITSADPHAAPEVVINCLADKDDAIPIKEGVRMAWKFIQSSKLKPQFEKILAWTDGMINSDVALDKAVNTFVRPSAHACGSTRMGSSPDVNSVVDPKGKVYGIDNLWVADGSVVPMIPSSPPHLTVLMMAEKLAANLQMQ